MSELSEVRPITDEVKFAAAMQKLNVGRLVLQIHGASFPSDPEEDLGRGSPYSGGAERFLRFARRLGYNALQLGPRGKTDRGNNSPYDSTIFSRNPLDLPLKRYVDQGRLSRTTWQSMRGSLPAPRHGVVPYMLVFDAIHAVLPEIVANASASDRAAAHNFLETNRVWLIPDTLYGILCREHGDRSWPAWGTSEPGILDQRLFHPTETQQHSAAARLAELTERHAREIEDHALIQWLLTEEANAFRIKAKTIGLALYGDLQVGLSQQDVWSFRRLFLDDYRMGAPPSRTTARGQPWGFPVLDPQQFGSPQAPGPALSFVRARVQRLAAECDSVRVDHPHGWVDPWVYRVDDPDPFHAVQSGARLFSSPDDPRHPQLAVYAIARPDQIDKSQSLYADGHVVDLNDEQVRRYAILMDEIVTQQPATGRSAESVACEVLSTLPYPVGRVLARQGLGRFRVAQKLNLTDPSDVYRIENAEPEDWIMLGSHDTPPIWRLADLWHQDGSDLAWGRYLAERLVPPAQRATFAAEIATNPDRLVNSCFAAMLASRARHVVVFFADQLGMTERYNEPGVVSDANWSLRVPADFEEFHANQLRQGQALDLEACFSLAANAVECSTANLNPLENGHGKIG